MKYDYELDSADDLVAEWQEYGCEDGFKEGTLLRKIMNACYLDGYKAAVQGKKAFNE